MRLYQEEIIRYFDLKGMPESSRESYLRRIHAFVAYMTKHLASLTDIAERDIQDYILYLKKEKGLSAGTINTYISAARFFYTLILGKEWNAKRIPRMKRLQIFPVIPPKQDVLAIIQATTNSLHKAFLVLLYGSGLRVGEVAALRIRDICSKTMRVRVENAKHNTNRYTILSETALAVLRTYFRMHFSPGSYTLDDWLFPGRDTSEHVSIKTIKNTLIKLRNRLQLDQRISAHTLRHYVESQVM